MFRHGELAAGSTKAVDHLDRHHVRRPHRVVPHGHVLVHDLIQLQEMPQPQAEPYVTEGTPVRPPGRRQLDADHVGLLRQRKGAVVRKQSKLLRLSLAIVEDGRPLPAPLLAVIQFSKVRHHSLPRPLLSPHALYEGIVVVRLARLPARVWP